MADIDPVIPAALAEFAAEIAARPMVPTHSDQATLHVGMSDLPWVEAGDGIA